MWTTKIKNVFKQGDTQFAFTVDFYKDGNLFDSFNFQNVSDPDSIKTLIRNRLNQYMKIDQLNIVEGDIDVSLPVISLPTQHDLDLAEFQRQKSLVVSAKQDLDLGVISQQDYDAIVVTFKLLPPVK